MIRTRLPDESGRAIEEWPPPRSASPSASSHHHPFLEFFVFMKFHRRMGLARHHIFRLIHRAALREMQANLFSRSGSLHAIAPRSNRHSLLTSSLQPPWVATRSSPLRDPAIPVSSPDTQHRQ